MSKTEKQTNQTYRHVQSTFGILKRRKRGVGERDNSNVSPQLFCLGYYTLELGKRARGFINK